DERRVREDLQRAHRDHRLGLLRTRQGPALRQLHGALRLRAVRRAGHDGLAARDDQGRPRLRLIPAPTLSFPLAGLGQLKHEPRVPRPTARAPRFAFPPLPTAKPARPPYAPLSFARLPYTPLFIHTYPKARPSSTSAPLPPR